MGEKPAVIIDTDILIKIFRGNKEHKRILQILSPDLIISCITQMELLIGCNNKKMQDEVQENLNSYKILLINNQIISIAKEIISKYSFSNKMSIVDNFIAATAIFYSLEIYTDNKKHFNFIEEVTLFSPDKL
ncbi:MAG: type II toxin-antitoxin system VapC family toxin [Ginsengibacter sp.]